MEGTSVGKYQIRACIGRGAVGVVHEGWDSVLARKVAIKMLPLIGTGEEGRETHSRFLREAQAAASLYHRNIVGIYDYGETEASAYIVMELIEGSALNVLLDTAERPSVAEIAAIMEGLLAGLQHSHERGVVHRDVKPANILMAADGRVKITDFGIAHLESSVMTQVGSVIGTPAYMSPEQVLGEHIDARTDIYSAGIVLYQMLLGHRPFEGSTASIMHKIVNIPPSLPPDLLAMVSPSMGAILATALSKRPEERYGSAQEFARVLREELGSADAAISAPERRARSPGDPAGTAGAALGTLSETVLAIPGPPRSMPDFAPVQAADAGATADAGQEARRPHGSRRAARLALAAAACLLLGSAGWWALGVSRRPAAPARTALVSEPAEPLPATPVPPPGPPGGKAESTAPEAAPARNDPSAATIAPGAPPPAQASDTPLPPIPAARPAPAPPPGPPPAVAAALQAFGSAAATVPCSLLLARTAERDGLVLGGLTALGDASEMQIQAALRRLLTQAAPATPVTWDIHRVEGPYCGVLDLLRAARSGDADPAPAPMLALAGQPARLMAGETVELSVAAPDGSAALLLDYFAPDRSVTHLLPTGGEAARIYGPGSPVRPAASDGGFPIQVPRGAGLITVIASSAPLLSQDRPVREAASAYLADLKASLDEARGRGAQLTAEALTVANTGQ